MVAISSGDRRDINGAVFLSYVSFNAKNGLTMSFTIHLSPSLRHG